MQGIPEQGTSFPNVVDLLGSRVLGIVVKVVYIYRNQNSNHLILLGPN